MKTIFLGLIAGLAIGASTPAAGQDITAVTGATIIGAGGAPIADGVVVIEGTRIARVGPAATTVVPGNAVVIDARGKFVMPGLADMHNHVRTGSFRLQQNIALNLAVLLSSG